MKKLELGTKVVPFQKTAGFRQLEGFIEGESYKGYLYVARYVLSTKCPNIRDLGVFRREDFKLYRERKPIEIKEGFYYRLKPIKQLLKEGLIRDCGDGWFSPVSEETQIGIISTGITPTMTENWNKPIKIFNIDDEKERLRAKIVNINKEKSITTWYYKKEWIQKVSIIN